MLVFHSKEGLDKFHKAIKREVQSFKIEYIMENQISKETLEHLVLLIQEEKPVNATFVVTSKKTGTDYTYKIVCNTGRNNYFVSLFYEIGYKDFAKCGFYLNDNAFLLNKYKDTTSEAIKGAIWFLKTLLTDIPKLLKFVSVTHTGSCLKCGRELTDAESIEYGMGKTCREMYYANK